MLVLQILTITICSCLKECNKHYYHWLEIFRCLIKSGQLNIYVNFNPCDMLCKYNGESDTTFPQKIYLKHVHLWNRIVFGKNTREKAPMEDDDLYFSFTVDLLTPKGFLFYRLSTSIRELQNFKVLLQQTR